MSGTLIFGIFLILIGAGLILKMVFHVDIPVVKIVFGLFIIYLGIRVIAGRNFHSCSIDNKNNDVIFGEASFNKADDWHQNQKNVIFGSSLIDLTSMQIPENTTKHIKINTVFGETKVKIRKDMPVKVKVDAAFAGADLPGGNQTAFGTTYYNNADTTTTSGTLEIEASVVFGALKVIVVE